MNYNTYLGYILPNLNKGQPNGIAELDSSGKVPSNQLPSYVDDVIEYNNIRDFPLIGEKGKIYIDTLNNKVYRWSGSQYIEISSGEGSDNISLEETTYAELKAKRDNGELTPGGQYRITDYVCTTTQEETRAVSHPFDIIVVADDESTLNENARACLHDGDTYYSAEGSSAVLEAWELKYRIDNDTNQFPWVDATNGKGVIYWMKDNFNNECPYDFKQIQFKRYKITECEAVPSLVGKYTASQRGDAITAIDEENPVWCYTFSVNLSEDMVDSSVNSIALENKISAVSPVSGNKLNGIVFIGNGCGFNTFGYYCYSNTFGDECSFNTFGNGCYSNTFGDGCNPNTFGNGCYSNTFGYGCGFNTFGNECNSITFGDGCGFNTFGNECDSNTFGNECSFNTFGYYCYSNTFGNGCNSNTFGNGCYSNTFGYGCNSNTFGDECNSNTFGYGCNSNTFGDGCSVIDFALGTTDIKQYYHVLDGVAGTGSSRITIAAISGRNYDTYVGKDSNGNLKTWIPSDLIVDVDLSEFSQMTAKQKSALFDKCINALKSGIPVCAIAYGYTTFANSYNYTETDGVIASGTIGFLGTVSVVPNIGSASLNAATVKKENGDVTFSVAPIDIGS